MKRTALTEREILKIQNDIDKSAVFGALKTKICGMVFERPYTKLTLYYHLINLAEYRKTDKRESTGITEA
jgi:hypothetical protein